jgi:hypothetical protein
VRLVVGGQDGALRGGGGGLERGEAGWQAAFEMAGIVNGCSVLGFCGWKQGRRIGTVPSVKTGRMPSGSYFVGGVTMVPALVLNARLVLDV